MKKLKLRGQSHPSKAAQPVVAVYHPTQVGDGGNQRKPPELCGGVIVLLDQAKPQGKDDPCTSCHLQSGSSNHPL